MIGKQRHEEFDTTMAFTSPKEVLVEVASSSTIVVDVCDDDSTHDVICQELTDADTISYCSVEFGSEDVCKSQQL